MKTQSWLAAGVFAAVAAASPLATSPAKAQGALVMYCGVQEEWCRAMSTAFEKETGIKVAMTRKSAGEIYAQLKAESANPRGDIWWGGTGDPHLQAAEEGLTQEYESPANKDLNDWAISQWKAAKQRSIGIYAGALGFGFNTQQIKSKGMAEPKCWADLLDPKLKDDVQVADPNSSGTAYNLLATVVQLMGEDKAFAYLKALHKNINQYTKSGAAPAKATSLGETAVGIVFIHDAVVFAVQGDPIKPVAPCEGTGYEIGSMSIVKGARNLDNAKKFYDWALTPAAQGLAGPAKSYQVPSNKNAPVPPQSPKMSEMKLIDYDFVKYGSSAERTRLLAKWDREVKALPK
ncbi:ABC transporter substrate-binding protein [Bosea vaviloviae]|uniref:Iron ABC transporter substrate-binding protein n=1 Tax=Bosea vaviloviae TaxID=1526658 RepID=A0A1D7U015_9HYPH|nr:ABC transporter substrate-binding protein [Bosea vaviloviae]AOO80715.1 iron ABC transporter substrate-binding protein [Bosea vaviloviae]